MTLKDFQNKEREGMLFRGYKYFMEGSFYVAYYQITLLSFLEFTNL